MRNRVSKFTIDLLLWTGALFLAFWFRVESGWVQYADEIVMLGLIGVPVKGLLIFVLQFHRRSWHRVSMQDLVVLIGGVGVVALLFFVVALIPNGIVQVPRSVPLIEGMVALLLMSGARLLTRLLYEHGGFQRNGTKPRRVVIAGAGSAGTMIAREMQRHPESNLKPVGFLDDDPSKQLGRFLGLKVLGELDDLPVIARRERIDEVIVAMPSQPGPVIRRVVDLAREAGVRERILPSIYELLDGTVTVSQIRDVNVEDLLRREPVRLEMQQIESYLQDRVVLVSGGGGSIGSEIVRQVAMVGPRRLVLVGRGENSIYGIQQELRRSFPRLEVGAVIADIRDREKLEDVFREERPEVIFHAAAHKHVPLMEEHPDQAVFNNVGGTRNLVELALDYDVRRFVNISTDKAINPTSVMGTTKRVAEHLVQQASKRATARQAFVTVRFGNVLASRGSVIPLFREQIRQGGPVTVTHPEMRRYFMTIPEASQLVLQAGSMAQNGAVYVLDMGEPVKIMDLARDLIMLSGFKPEVDIEIEVTGIRPGEKLFEELLSKKEGVSASRHEKIFVARKAELSPREFEADLDELFSVAATRDGDAIRRALHKIVPAYQIGEPVQKVAASAR